jgi:hypothetical protein
LTQKNFPQKKILLRIATNTATCDNLRNAAKAKEDLAQKNRELVSYSLTLNVQGNGETEDEVVALIVRGIGNIGMLCELEFNILMLGSFDLFFKLERRRPKMRSRL